MFFAPLGLRTGEPLSNFLKGGSMSQSLHTISTTESVEEVFTMDPMIRWPATQSVQALQSLRVSEHMAHLSHGPNSL